MLAWLRSQDGANLHWALVRSGDVACARDVVWERVEAVAVIPVLDYRDRSVLIFQSLHSTREPTWLGNWIVPLVRLQVVLITQSVSRGPPVADVILIMPIERAHVEDHGLASLHVHSRVAIPAITVDQARLDTPALFLERKEETRNDFLQSTVGYDVKLGPLQFHLGVVGEGG